MTNNRIAPSVVLQVCRGFSSRGRTRFCLLTCTVGSIMFIGILLVMGAVSGESNEPPISANEFRYYLNNVQAQQVPVEAETDTLEFVQIVYRHGDRTPSTLIPTDVGNDKSTWPEGLGELTKKGFQQHFRLGQWFRKRYGKFMGEKFDRRSIYVRSSDFNRTLMSALANLAGFFPPSKSEKWNDFIDWQPVPVHTVQKDVDIQLNEQINCPTAQDEMERMFFEDPKILEIERDHAVLFKHIEDHAGFSFKLRLRHLWFIFDPLNSEFHHQDTHKWPLWVNQSLWQRIQQLYDESAQFTFHNPLLRRLRGGPLVQEIIGRFNEKTIGGLNPYAKMYIYSAHDTTVAAVLATLGIIPRVFPLYASSIMLEMHRKDGQHVIELFSKNVTDAEAVFRLNIEGCEAPCTVEKLANSFKDFFPKDWHSECGLIGLNVDSLTSGLWVLIVFLSFSTLFLATILILDIILKKRRRRRKSPTERELMAEDDEEVDLRL